MNVAELIERLQEQPPTATVLVRAEGMIDTHTGHTELFTDRAERAQLTEAGTVIIEHGEPRLPFEAC